MYNNKYYYCIDNTYIYIYIYLVNIEKYHEVRDREGGDSKLYDCVYVYIYICIYIYIYYIIIV